MLTPAPRSAFVTVIAWIFIVLSGIATFMGAFQVLFLVALFTDAEIAAEAARHPAAPEIGRWLFSHLRMIALGFWLVALLTLVSAIGVLKRREWARKLFIVSLALGIASLLAGMAMQYLVLSAIASGAEMGFLMRAAGVAWTLVGVVFSAGFLALIVKMASTSVAREFGPGA